MKQKGRRIPLQAVALEGTGPRYRARLIREGMSQNRQVWPRAVLEKMVGILEGVPVHLYDFTGDASRRFLHHWEALREKLPPAIARLLPERLPGATVAHVRNPRLVVADGVAAIEGEIEVTAERAPLVRAVLEQFRRMGRDLGLSIHVPPDGLADVTRPGGVREFTDVSRVVGFDLVSFPSAGGRVLPALEALARRRSMKIRSLLRHLAKAKRAALEGKIPKGADEIESVDAFLESEDLADFREAALEAFELEELDEAGQKGALEALFRFAPPEEEQPPKGKAKKPAPKAKAKKARPALEEEREDEPDPDGGDDDDDAGEGAALEATIREEMLEAGRERIAAALEAAKLPKGLATFAEKHLTAALEAKGRLSRKEADDFVAELKKGLGSSDRPGGSALEASAMRVESSGPEWTTGPRYEAALEAMIAGQPFGEIRDGDRTIRVPALPGLRHAYQIATGDMLMEGAAFLDRRPRGTSALEGLNWEANPFFVAYRSRRSALEATMTRASFPLLLSNLVHKRTLKEYALLTHVWKMVASTANVSDFKQRNVLQLGSFGNLAVVNENTAYADLAIPTEDDVTATIVKYGGLAHLTWEAIVNDELKRLQAIPRLMARAAERTLNTLVWGRILNNSNIYDGTALFTAGHNNLNSVAYSAANLKTMRQKMVRQKDLDNRETGFVKPRNIFVGPTLIDTVSEDVGSNGKAQLTATDTNQAAGTARTITTENEGKPNVFKTRYGLGVVEVAEFDLVAGADDNWYLAADPMETEIIEVGFLGGEQNPQIFVQDLERVGAMFDLDKVIWKVRHVHDGGVVVDFRGIQGGIAP